MNIPKSDGSVQDLLAERRANALELHRETDTARAMLAWHIDRIDEKLAALR